MKNVLLKMWFINEQIKGWVVFSRWIYFNIPCIGKFVSFILDRFLLMIYSIDLQSFSIDVKNLNISHPSGVLLGGNGIYSKGRVAVMSGVKFVGKSPTNSDFLQKHREKKVFELGDNVVIGANSVVIGPVKICDNVIIGAMSLVNKDIVAPGVYVGVPVRKISDTVTDEWFS